MWISLAHTYCQTQLQLVNRKLTIFSHLSVHRSELSILEEDAKVSEPVVYG